MNHKISSIVVGAVLSALFTADAHANRACCFPDGSCTMVREKGECAGGEIQGRGVTCADNPCGPSCEDALAALQDELAELQLQLDAALADLQTCEENCGPTCGDGVCECDEENNCCEDCGGGICDPTGTACCFDQDCPQSHCTGFPPLPCTENHHCTASAGICQRDACVREPD